MIQKVIKIQLKDQVNPEY